MFTSLKRFIDYFCIISYILSTRCKIRLAMIIDKETVKRIEFCFYYQMCHMQII